ncbi:tetratricopeptide repeat protein [Thalassoglobus polymorphus]|uniref:Lipoprotein NlpI n=1 Tax=Thalassoglobus polymorphus TaxID=2527994 RepID=A0A517QUY6_9PLAN|nr:tetratricopeptide repeat protein [Thalassoglobus polymorphus]QDT35397.1 lipoprotein NlpI [Thalassoglobus polymorphus]
MNLRRLKTSLEQFARPCAREERISLGKMLFATRKILQTNSKDALEHLQCFSCPRSTFSQVHSRCATRQDCYTFIKTALVAVLLVTTCGCTGLTGYMPIGRSTEDGLSLRSIDQQTQAEACRLTALELAAHEKDEHAISQFEQARKFDPTIKGIAHPLAVLYDRQGRLDAAQREYAKAIAESPKDADVLNDFGYFLYSRGEPEQAAVKLKRALELQPNHLKAAVNLAMVRAKQGKYDEAFVYFEKAQGPAAAHRNIGLLQLRAGQTESALAHLRKSSVIDPSLGSGELLAALPASSKEAGQSQVLPASYTE